MIHEEICTYEVSQLAKEKGFNVQTFDWYDYTGNYHKGFIPHELHECPRYKEYYAPTQSLLQRWLREVHNLHIDVGVWEDCDEDADGLCCGTYSYWSFNIQSCFTGDLIYEEFEHRYDTYEQAVEDALKYTLKFLV